MRSSRPRFPRPPAANLDATSGRSCRYSFLTNVRAKFYRHKKAQKTKIFVFLVPFCGRFCFCILATPHARDSFLLIRISATTRDNRNAEEMPENVCNEDPVTWKQFRN